MLLSSPHLSLAYNRWRPSPSVVMILLIGLSGIVSPASSHAQTHQIRFQRLSIGQGLIVKAIVQDQRGLMWFGTMDGLYRYDGYQFKLYRHDPQDAGSLSNNDIRALCLDHAGQLWVGTRKGGLNRFDYLTDKFTRFNHDPANPDSLSGDVIEAIYEDRSGNLWIGTEGGVDKYDRATGRFIHLKDPQAEMRDVEAITQDLAGAIWIGTFDGLYRYDPATGSFRQFRQRPGDDASLIHSTIRSLCTDQAGTLWIGTDGGLDSYDPATGRFTHYRHAPNDPYSLSHNLVDVVYQDRAGRLWIGTDGGGLNRFDRATGRFIRHRFDPANPDSLSSDLVPAIFEDRSGLLWIGADGGMLNRYQPATSLFAHFAHDAKEPASLSEGWVRGITEDSFGRVWLGLEDGGLNQYDPATGRFLHFPYAQDNPHSPAANNIWSIYRDKAGMIWLCTQQGLDRVDPATGRFTHFKHDPTNPDSLIIDDINVVCEDSTGMLWIGTEGGGLDRYDHTTGRFRHFKYDPENPRGISHPEIECLYEDRTGTLWIGTGGGGLNRYDRQTDRFTHYRLDPNNPHSLSHDEIRAIYEARDGTLWIGTEGGLNLFDRQTGSFTRFTVREGLPNDTVSNILEDEQGNLWLATNKGLSRFNPQTRTFRNYDSDDGLLSYHFMPGAAYRAPNGEMYFGANDGLIRFRPELIRDSEFKPPLVLTAFSKFGRAFTLERAITETREINLSWRDYVFSLEFAALDFSSPHRNQYAYKLEGFDPDWINSGTQRVATYTNLPGGNYVFKVRGTNGDGVWSDQELAVRITVTPPPWKTWWAYTLYVLAVVGSVIGYVRFKTQAQARRVEELDAQVTERTEQLNEKNQELENTLHHLEDAQTELQNANEDLLSVLDQLRLGVAIVEQNGTVAFLSQAAQNFLAISQEEADGQPLDKLLPLNEQDQVRLRELARLPQKQRARLPVHVQANDGHRYWMEIEVEDDPRDSQRKIFYLYDVSEIYDLRRLLDEKAKFHDLIAQSTAMQIVFKQIRDVARMETTALIEGETGTGKELVARAIHYSSPRKGRSFVAVNCAELTESLLASQLFGHKRGAFTGAIADHVGLFEAAAGGTLLLDEIGDLPLSIQASLLRVLQEKEITRLGESRSRKIDVRILAATHRNLHQRVAEGSFREDLLYRIRVARIALPPLRERLEDLPLLVSWFLGQFRATADRAQLEINSETMDFLREYSWPGNVRELRSAIEYAVINCRGSVIQPTDLPPEVIGATPGLPPLSALDEKDQLREALERTDGNRAAAARLLGISRPTLYSRLRAHGLMEK